MRVCPTFKELLDDGWTVASFIRPIDNQKIKARLQRYHAKGHVIKCHTDEEFNMFRIAHREKDLRDHFGSRKKGG